MAIFRQRPTSIANQLIFSLFLLAVLSPLLAGGGLIYLGFQSQLRQLDVLQQERSQTAADQINAYMDDLHRKLGYLARVRGLTELPPGTQKSLLEGLTRHNSAYEAVAILDRKGRVASAVTPYGGIGQVQADPLPFIRSYRLQEDYASPVSADPGSRLPVLTMSVPIRNRRDQVDGVLVARVNLSYLWSFVSRIDVGRTGYAYVLDDRNVLIAKQGDTPENFKLVDVSDRPFILKLTSGAHDPLAAYRGLKGSEVLGAIAPIRSVRWNVVVELPIAEAYASVRAMLLVMGLALAGATVAAVGLARFFAEQIVVPLERLTAAATRISAGELATRADVPSRNELGILATAFNVMTARLQEMITRLEQRVRERTVQLEAANKELEAFSYSVSHDLRTPLRSIDSFTEMLLDGYADQLDATGQDYLKRVRKASQRMAQLIDDLLQLSRMTRAEMHRATVDLSALARAILSELQQGQPERRVEAVIAEGITAPGDPRLMRVALENLLGNAWKFTGKRPNARIEFGAFGQDGEQVFFVRDNGAGFEMAYADKLFTPFQRLHTEEEFPGTGVGLATVKRIILRHGGQVWAEAATDRGATFFFTLKEGG